MKKIIKVLSMMMIMISLTGCGDNKESLVKPKAVTILATENTSQKVTLDYIGAVSTKEIVKYSFKVPGRIVNIYFDEGDSFKKGDALAKMDTTDLEFQVSAAKAMMETAELNIEKASQAVNYVNSLYDKVDKLYDKGAVSKDQYEQVQLQKEISQAEYSQAQQQYNAAKTDYDYKSDLLNHAVIYAEESGIVVKKIFNENENIGPYMPVLAVMSGEQIVNIGVPEQELNQIKVGSKASVIINKEKIEGTVSSIGQVPDEETRTYKTEVTLADKEFQLGATANVSINVGEEKGIWIPMSIISSDGENYVYIVEEDRVFKRIVQIKQNNEDQVLVEGISSGEQVVLSGIKNLYDGAGVIVKEQEGSHE